MRTTVVPAQITTVEDKIAGNLNFTQLIILVIPIFIDTLVYALLPERMHLNSYKAIIMVISFLIFGLLALRIKGKVLISWIILIAQYNLRPKYYIFDKNDLSFRKIENSVDQSEMFATTKVTVTRSRESITSPLTVLEKVLTKKSASIRFKPNKGGIYVAVE